MTSHHWQKSSFSGGAEGNCVYVAATADGTIRLRESDEPDTTLRTTHTPLAALLQHIKTEHHEV